MLISTSRNFIFSGINKTGTTSIIRELQPYRNRWQIAWYRRKHAWLNKGRPAFRHLPGRFCRDLVGARRWNNAFTFTFVRDPWARVLSEYTGHNHDPATPVIEGFRAWVENGGDWLARNGSMRRFVTDANGEPVFSFVGRIENIDDDWRIVTDALRLPYQSLRRENTSKAGTSVAEAYDAATAATVREWIADDLAYFGYPENPV